MRAKPIFSFILLLTLLEPAAASAAEAYCSEGILSKHVHKGRHLCCVASCEQWGCGKCFLAWDEHIVTHRDSCCAATIIKNDRECSAKEDTGCLTPPGKVVERSGNSPSPGANGASATLKNAKISDAERTPAQLAICYADRYEDLHRVYCSRRRCNLKGLQEHFETFGRREGRLYKCDLNTPNAGATNAITPDAERTPAQLARCYADRYEDLHRQYCSSRLGCNLKGLQEHFEIYGRTEGRHFGCSCAQGLISERKHNHSYACCASSCGRCGVSTDCSTLPGGAEQCCAAEIMKKNKKCTTEVDTGCTISQSRFEERGRASRHGCEAASKAASRASLDQFSSGVLQIGACSGLTNQRLELVNGIMLGVLLGMQVLLPATVPLDGQEYQHEGFDRHFGPFSNLYDEEALTRAVQSIFVDYWCGGGGADEHASPRWCQHNSAMVLIAAAPRDYIACAQIHRMSGRVPNGIDPRSVFRDKGVWKLPVGAKRVFLDAGCPTFALSISEAADAEMWGLFWRIDAAIQYAPLIKKHSSQVIGEIEAYGAAARSRAEPHGFSLAEGRGGGGGAGNEQSRSFHCLHLRAEQDWIEHCKNWMGLRDGYHRDNCINNTQSIATTLAIEGLDPRLPVYVATGLSGAELKALAISGQHGAGYGRLLETFTVVTKADLELGPLPSLAQLPREVNAAIDLLVALSAQDFVGNSVSSFSAYVLTRRGFNGQPAWHYNGGKTPLMDVVAPRRPAVVATFAEPLKWVFAVTAGASAMSKTFVDQVKVAVLSAQAKTSLIPVCVTTEPADSELSIWLVSRGVRVVLHSPLWAGRMREKVQGINDRHRDDGDFMKISHLYGDPDAMIGTFMRIDIPILGFLDEFILYTDVDVMFKADIDWTAILDGADMEVIRRDNDFASGRSNFARAGTRGVPLYFSASSESSKSEDPFFLNAGVMLLNMRSLRSTYDGFLAFIFANEDLNWEQGPGDQGAYKAFYAETADKTRKMGTRGNFLPYTLNWKSYWEPNDDAKLIHFHGPKCGSDYEPFIESGTVSREGFAPLLRFGTTTGDSVRLCREYNAYLEELE